MAVTTRASKATAKALKEQYHKYMDMLNYGTEWAKSIQVYSAKFQGRSLVVPIRTKKIQPGNFMNETDALPTPVAAESTYIEFDITMYAARLATTWLAQEFDDGSVVKLSKDLEDWIHSNNEMMEYSLLYGGRVRGVICEFPNDPTNGTATIDVDVAQNDNLGAAGAFRSEPIEVDYDGDFRCFRALGSTSPDGAVDEALQCYPGVSTSPSSATPATWVPINLRGLDDLEAIQSGHGFTLGVGTTSMQWFVVGTDELNSTLTLTCVADAANLSKATLQGLMPVGTGMGVELHDSTAVTARTFGNVVCWSTYASKEVAGVLTNLFFGTFGTKNRADGVAGATENLIALRSKSYIQSTAATGGRTALTAPRVLQLLDVVKGRAGMKPKKLHASPLFHSTYVAAVTAAFIVNLNTEGGARAKGDIANEATTLAGYAIEELRRMPRGMLLFSSPEAWKIVTPKKGGGLGSVPMLKFRTQNKNRDSDTYAHTTTTIWGVFQQVCFEPRSCAVYSGINIISELLD